MGALGYNRFCDGMNRWACCFLLVLFAACASGPAVVTEDAKDPVQVFLPQTSAGGRLSIAYLGPSGALIVHHSSRWYGAKPGKVFLPILWSGPTDPGDKSGRRHPEVRVGWEVELPAGHYIFGAMKNGDTLTFTLRKRWSRQIVRRSRPYPIEVGYTLAKPTPIIGSPDWSK